MRTDLDNAHTELRSISDKNEVNEASRYQLESKLRDSDSELQQLNVKMNGFQVNNQVSKNSRLIGHRVNCGLCSNKIFK